jgi:DNA-binding HxlR family transcriptional regulator
LSKKLKIEELNKAFDNRVRLGIMTVLLSQDWCDFTGLKETLGLTDGNLASHIKALEEEKYIEVRKSFIGKKPNSSYRATKLGRKSFLNHLETLQNIIKKSGI